MSSVLFVLACLSAQPAVCEEKIIPLDGVRNELPAECFGSAMEWAAQNPQFTIKRWRCGSIERSARVMSQYL